MQFGIYICCVCVWIFRIALLGTASECENVGTIRQLTTLQWNESKIKSGLTKWGEAGVGRRWDQIKSVGIAIVAEKFVINQRYIHRFQLVIA